MPCLQQPLPLASIPAPRSALQLFPTRSMRAGKVKSNTQAPPRTPSSALQAAASPSRGLQAPALLKGSPWTRLLSPLSLCPSAASLGPRAQVPPGVPAAKGPRGPGRRTRACTRANTHTHAAHTHALTPGRPRPHTLPHTHCPQSWSRAGGGAATPHLWRTGQPG